MLKTLKMLTLTALIGIGGFVVTPMVAQAQGLYLQFGDRHRDGAEFGLRFGDTGRPHRNWNRGGFDGPRCDQRDALRKASRMGLDNVRIEDRTPRSITVRGRDEYGRRDYITFGRAPHCPVIG